MMTLGYKRVTIFAGHYGSGKTNAAVNWALALSREGKKTAIADLDIVNPYFRTKDSEAVLSANGVRLISSPFANTNVDAPALPAEAYSVTDDKSVHAVLDVGGDDRGATALGRYRDAILAENDYEMLFVINRYRPLTPDAQSTVEVMREVEAAGAIPFTAIVNCSNLGTQTTCEDITASVDYAHRVSELTGLPIKMTVVRHDLAAQVTQKINNVFPIRIYVSQSWNRDEGKEI